MNILKLYKKRLVGSLIQRGRYNNLFEVHNSSVIVFLTNKLFITKNNITKWKKNIFLYKVIKTFKQNIRLIEITTKKTENIFKIYYIHHEDNDIKGHFILVCDLKKNFGEILDIRYNKEWFFENNKNNENQEKLFIKILIYQSFRIKLNKIIIKKQKNTIKNNKRYYFQTFYIDKSFKSWYEDYFNFKKKISHNYIRMNTSTIRNIKNKLNVNRKLDRFLYKMLEDFETYNFTTLNNNYNNHFSLNYNNENNYNLNNVNNTNMDKHIMKYKNMYIGYFFDKYLKCIKIEICSDKKMKNKLLMEVDNYVSVIQSISKQNKQNIFFDSKKIINMAIKISQKLNIKKIELVDNSMFDCVDKKISLSFFYFLKYGKPWYSYHFGFKLQKKSDRVKYKKSLKTIHKLTVSDILSKIPEFREYMIINQNTNEIDINTNFIEYFNRNIQMGRLNKKHCRFLSNKHFFTKLISNFDLINFHGKVFDLSL